MLSLRFLCKYCEQASEPTKAIPLIINLLMLLRPVYSFPQSDKNASRDLPACSVRYRPRQLAMELVHPGNMWCHVFVSKGDKCSARTMKGLSVRGIVTNFLMR
jgi:hypothetical protein